MWTSSISQYTSNQPVCGCHTCTVSARVLEAFGVPAETVRDYITKMAPIEGKGDSIFMIPTTLVRDRSHNYWATKLLELIKKSGAFIAASLKR
jgi:hypothetical protein